LALAEPVPFTVAILSVKSLTRVRSAFDMVSFALGFAAGCGVECGTE
jgi:hypothetical protein